MLGIHHRKPAAIMLHSWGMTVFVHHTKRKKRQFSPAGIQTGQRTIRRGAHLWAPPTEYNTHTNILSDDATVSRRCQSILRCFMPSLPMPICCTQGSTLSISGPLQTTWTPWESGESGDKQGKRGEIHFCSGGNGDRGLLWVAKAFVQTLCQLSYGVGTLYGGRTTALKQKDRVLLLSNRTKHASLPCSSIKPSVLPVLFFFTVENYRPFPMNSQKNSEGLELFKHTTHKVQDMSYAMQMKRLCSVPGHCVPETGKGKQYNFQQIGAGTLW